MSSRQKEKNPATPSKLRAGAAALLSPPINLATKPRPSHQHPANNTEQPKCGNRTLVPVYVLPEHLKAVQVFVLSLGQTPFPAPESDRDCDPFLHPEELDNANSSDSDNSVELVSLSSWMSTSNISTPSSLSTSDISTPSTLSASSLCNRAPAFTFSARAPIPSAGDILLGSSTSPHTSINKYYSILIGKKTGVFWDQWVNVEPYVKNVSGARHKSFRTHDQALSYYLDAKAEHRVRVVRNPGDDAVYGPRSEAMQ